VTTAEFAPARAGAAGTSLDDEACRDRTTMTARYALALVCTLVSWTACSRPVCAQAAEPAQPSAPRVHPSAPNAAIIPLGTLGGAVIGLGVGTAIDLTVFAIHARDYLNPNSGRSLRNPEAVTTLVAGSAFGAFVGLSAATIVYAQERAAFEASLVPTESGAYGRLRVRF